MRCFAETIKLKPDFAEAYSNRGLAYDRKGEYDQAIADFNKAIELEPGYAKAYNNRGLAYGRKGEYDQTIADFDKAIELEPDYAEAYNNRGNAHARRGKYDLAIDEDAEVRFSSSGPVHRYKAGDVISVKVEVYP